MGSVGGPALPRGPEVPFLPLPTLDMLTVPWSVCLKLGPAGIQAPREWWGVSMHLLIGREAGLGQYRRLATVRTWGGDSDMSGALGAGMEIGRDSGPFLGAQHFLSLREMRGSRDLGRLVHPFSPGCLPFIGGWAPKPLMPKEWVRNVECRCQPSGSSAVRHPGRLLDGSTWLPALCRSGSGCSCRKLG